MGTEPVILVGTYRMPTDEALFQELSNDMTQFVETSEPRVIAFATYVNAERTELTTVQVHPDAASLLFHFEAAAARIARGSQAVDLMAVSLYGSVDQAVADALRRESRGWPVDIKEPLRGFTRR